MNIMSYNIKILIFFFSLSNYIFGQGLIEIQSQIDSLLVVRSKLELSLDSIKKKIRELEAQKLQIQVENDTTNGVLVVLTTDVNMRDKPSVIGNIVRNLPKNSEVLVIGYSSRYYKIKIGNEIGYINEMFLPNNEALDRIAKLEKSNQYRKIDHKQSKTKKTYTTSRTSSSQSKTIHIGPHGVEYYINSKGKKVYVKKK